MAVTIEQIISFAAMEVFWCGGSQVESEHLLLGLIGTDKDFAVRFFGSNFFEVTKAVKKFMPERQKNTASCWLPGSQNHQEHNDQNIRERFYKTASLSKECDRILEDALKESKRYGRFHAQAEDLLAALLREEGCLAVKFMCDFGIDLEKLRQEISKAPDATERS